jgi:hypothetical protein
MSADPAAAGRRPYLDLRRATRLKIQTTNTNAMAQGARNAIATPIMRKLHIIAAALCAKVRRNVANIPVS